MLRKNNKKELEKYENWIHECYMFVGEPRLDLFATGGGGTLYPSGCIDKIFLNKKNIKMKCLYADDIWVKYAEIASNAIPVVNTGLYWEEQIINNIEFDRNKLINNYSQVLKSEICSILCKNVCIYGAGVYAKRFIDIAFEYGLLERIERILVSDIDGCIDAYRGIEVSQYTPQKDNNERIIICTKWKKSREIENYLLMAGATEITKLSLKMINLLEIFC